MGAGARRRRGRWGRGRRHATTSTLHGGGRSSPTAGQGDAAEHEELHVAEGVIVHSLVTTEWAKIVRGTKQLNPTSCRLSSLLVTLIQSHLSFLNHHRSLSLYAYVLGVVLCQDFGNAAHAFLGVNTFKMML